MTGANEAAAREIEQTKCAGHAGSITIREKVCSLCLTAAIAAALDMKDKRIAELRNALFNETISPASEFPK
jgi:hypothetical protein